MARLTWRTLPREMRLFFAYWLREVLGEASYRRRLRAAGIDISSVSLRQMGLDESRAHNHANSGGPALEKVFRTLQITDQDAILDLGCGKGGALLTMAMFPFRRIAGLELCPEILRIAQENMARAGLNRVELIHGDAALFTDYDDFTHIYLYNPFPEPVLRSVLHNLEDSLRRAPRRLTLIYKNPRFHDLVAASGLFVLDRLFTHAGHPIHVYVTTEGCPGQPEKAGS